MLESSLRSHKERNAVLEAELTFLQKEIKDISGVNKELHSTVAAMKKKIEEDEISMMHLHS